jgi:hypothetical protein
MLLTHIEIDKILRMLEETPQYIQTLINDSSAEAVYFKADEHSWSLNENLAHLRACSDIGGKDIRRMLSEHNPTIRYVSPRTHMKKTGYEKLLFVDSFESYQEQRRQLLEILRDLSLEAWKKQATFTGTTRGKYQTVFSYAKRIAEHEHHHFPQIAQVLEMFRNKHV